MLAPFTIVQFFPAQICDRTVTAVHLFQTLLLAERVIRYAPVNEMQTGGFRGMEGLKDKVAIVTGGATLIGASVVRAFHRAGTKVAIADINTKDGQAIADELRPERNFCENRSGR